MPRKNATIQAIFAALLLLASGSAAQERNLEISGFGDLVYVGGEDRFELGQVEVDLGAPLAAPIDLEIALALDERTFTTGVFTVDFHLFGSQGEHFRPTHGIDHSGIIVGQFDVPLGLDWQVYPSIDRRLFSGPVAVEHIHDFWNDIGIQGYVKAGRFDAVGYAVNGFGYETGEAAVDMNLALGGRLGVRYFPQLEIGGSCAGFYDADYELDMTLIGVDAQFAWGGFSAKGEYLIHRPGLAGGSDLTHTGFYGQGQYDLGCYFLVARYGQFRPEEEEKLKRLSIGGGWIVAEGCQARLEQQINAKENDLTIAQLVVAF